MNTERKKITLNMLAVMTFIILGMVQLIILNRFSTVGGKLNEINTLINETEKQNSILIEKIASASSISVVWVKADQMGLKKSPTLISLDQPIPMAFRPRLTL